MSGVSLPVEGRFRAGCVYGLSSVQRLEGGSTARLQSAMNTRGVTTGVYDGFFISAADGLCTRPTLEMMHERLGRLPEVRKPERYPQKVCKQSGGVPSV